MPNIASLLKAEISRVARKEVRAQVESLRKASGQYCSSIAALKREVTVLERQLARLQKNGDPMGQSDLLEVKLTSIDHSLPLCEAARRAEAEDQRCRARHGDKQGNAHAPLLRDFGARGARGSGPALCLLRGRFAGISRARPGSADHQAWMTVSGTGAILTQARDSVAAMAR